VAQEDIEIIRRGYEAFNREGPESIYEWLDPDVEWRNPADSMDRNVWRGHEGVATWFRDFAYEQFEWMRFHPDRFIDLGDRVLILCRAEFRARGSGIEMEVPFAHLVTIRDGKATSLSMFSDQGAAMEAAGLDPSQ
jgi:ketosteroid isomerase-like protein